MLPRQWWCQAQWRVQVPDLLHRNMPPPPSPSSPSSFSFSSSPSSSCCFSCFSSCSSSPIPTRSRNCICAEEAHNSRKLSFDVFRMNSDEEAAELEPVGDEPIQKRYRRYHSVEFHDKLLVSVMIVVKAYGRVDMPFVYWMLLDEWHAQIKDETKHPRPKGFDLYTAAQNFCCFKNHAEWIACGLLSKGRGREKTISGEVPSLTTHCQEWASKKFIKWQEIAREIQNNIHPRFVRQHFCFAM